MACLEAKSNTKLDDVSSFGKRLDKLPPHFLTTLLPRLRRQRAGTPAAADSDVPPDSKFTKQLLALDKALVGVDLSPSVTPPLLTLGYIGGGYMTPSVLKKAKQSGFRVVLPKSAREDFIIDGPAPPGDYTRANFRGAAESSPERGAAGSVWSFIRDVFSSLVRCRASRLANSLA